MSRSKLPNLNTARRVLIIRGSAIGDVIHATPVSAALKEAFPHLELTWIVEEICGDVIRGNPYLHEVIVTPRSRWKQGRLRSPRIWAEYLAFLKSLRRRNFDVTIDLQGYAKSAFLALATGAPYRVGWWKMRDGSGLVSQSIPHRPQSVHRVDRFLDVARALGAEPKMVRFPLQVPDTARAHVDELLRAGGLAPDRPYAVLNRAAGDASRRWSEANFARVAWELARRYGMPSVLVGVKADVVPNEEIINGYQQLAAASRSVLPHGEAQAESNGDNSADVPPPLNIAGQTNLKELFAVIERCAIHICGDTGSLHIAVALGRPVVTMYGASDPAHAGPWGHEQDVLSRRELCSPQCALRKCVYAESADGQAATSRCLAAVTPEDVMQKAAQVLTPQ